MPDYFKFLTTTVFGLALATTVQASPVTLSPDELSGLQQQSSTQFDEVYVRGDITPAGLHIAAVTLGIEDPSERYILGVRDLERLRSGFENALRANSPDGNATITLEVTLMELVPNRVITETSSRTSRYNRSSGIGRASMEAVFRDARTGEVVMVIVDERTGLPLTHNIHSFSNRIWGDAADILEDWAVELPAAL